MKETRTLRIHFFKSDYTRALIILVRALSHLSTNYTNQGYRIKTSSTKTLTCVLGAIEVATNEIENRHIRDSDPAVVIANETAISVYGMSAVSVSDDLGYSHAIRLLSLAIEKAHSYATGIDKRVQHVNPSRTRDTA